MEKGLAMYRKSLDSIAVVASALLLAGACLPPGSAIADTGSAPGRVQLAGWDMAPDRITTVDIDPAVAFGDMRLEGSAVVLLARMPCVRWAIWNSIRQAKPSW